MKSTLEVRNLVKTYGAITAVTSFSHVFRPGEITTIVGPSGSGKSTTLWLMAGLIQPESGQVLIDGVDVTGRLAERRDVGMVFQSYALFPHLTVQENVEFGLRVRGIPKPERQRRALDILELVHMEGSAQRSVQKLSGGEQQRVALARALAFKPRVLLMDEPLSALDAKLREELRAELFRLLNELGLTTVYVTHDQTEAMALGSEMIVMHRGHIEQAGLPSDLYHRPASLFVADFLGAANIFEGVHSQGAIRLPFVSVPGSPNLPEGDCFVMIRPEDFEIVGPGDAHFSAEVGAIAFLGSHLRLSAVAEGQPLVIDVRNDVVLDPSRPLSLRIRTDKAFSWPRPAAQGVSQEWTQELTGEGGVIAAKEQTR